ncbi:hypothetical protein [Mucilaginibacter myungsuensis]|uniref:Uncharacterized protein n=1 Tax=Mucilaginibacter myungsuensis TaxID=649104 RepID=A0A929KU74_9SPHI|nr:hypothetical protein [Mucilaginibacter myungsuensis]MBE9660478.1 hypothetical protein [Mucilaginibacter myungsuensis]MDN3600522.1 hypothetical protein [Mucilaginibacter myungsuensis]
MKKILLSFNIVLFGLAGSAQTTKKVRLDEVVSLTLPADVRKIDTLGQQTYTANSRYGYMIVSRVPNGEQKVLKKEKELKKIFKDYIKEVQAGLPEGTITDSKDTIMNKLEVHDFVLRTDTGSGVQLRKFRILYTKPVTYTFQYLYDEQRQDVAAEEMKAFFAGIKSPPELDGTDQYLTFGKWQGVSGTLIIIGVSVIAVIIFVILMVRRKRKHDMLIDNLYQK